MTVSPGAAHGRTAAGSVSSLVLEGPRRLVVVESDPVPLTAGQVRVRTLYSGISAGTEITSYRGTNPYLHKRWDPTTRLFTEGAASAPYPLSGWGYEEVGIVTEVVDPADEPLLGSVVYGTWGHRSEAVVAAGQVHPRVLPPGLDPLLGIFSRIGSIALNGIHDARIRLGETVVVVGLGALGQIVAQAARRSGATVVGADLHPGRRALAERLGTPLVLDPGAATLAEQVKDITGGRGADVVLEVTGSSTALNEAIRCAAYSSRVVTLGFMPGEAAGLFLGEEFHHNRITLVCSQISGTDPEIAHRWDAVRLAGTVMRLQDEGRLDLLPLVSHVRPVAEAAALFQLVDERPQEVVQAVLSFPRDGDAAPSPR
jgi:threonine dehydrogenase-like Zn-dependent dehydrogenase